ncbi:MAG: T9SS C-terminal target domain-containing protein [Calditrichaeota bacterium]|nr:MAG: T9SS C-terminal target domain-containing protein [Calditrichota bacterium]
MRIICRGQLLIFVLAMALNAQTPPIEMTLTVKDSQGGSQELVFGLKPEATSNLDAHLGEAELPPYPPAGIFDARFIGSELAGIELGQGSYCDFRQGNMSFQGTVEHELRYQAASGDSIIIAWVLPDSMTGLLEDFFGGLTIKKEMRGEGEFVIADPAIIDKLKLTINYPGFLAVPSQPDLISPLENATGVQHEPTLVWGKVDFAQMYNVQCFAMKDSNELVFSRRGIIDTSLVLPQLEPETEYQWQIQAQNLTVVGPWAEGHFSTGKAEVGPPEIPFRLFPAADAVNVPVTPLARWQNQEQATQYDLQVYFAGSFSQLIIDVTVVADTFFQITGLQPEATYFWRIRAGNDSGKSEWSDLKQFKTASVTAINDEVSPVQVAIFANYPNPFNPETNFKFHLEKIRFVTLAIYNIRGQLVEKLLQESLPAGEHVVRWDASKFSSGKYMAIFQADDFKQSQILTLLK